MEPNLLFVDKANIFSEGRVDGLGDAIDGKASASCGAVPKNLVQILECFVALQLSPVIVEDVDIVQNLVVGQIFAGD